MFFKNKKYIIVSSIFHLILFLFLYIGHIYYANNQYFVSKDNSEVIFQITGVVNNNELLVEEEEAPHDGIDKLKQEDSQINDDNINNVVEHSSQVNDSKKITKKEEDEKVIKNNDLSSLSNKEIILSAEQKKQIEYEISNNISPSYPEIAKRFQISNQVIIQTKLLINEQGVVENIEFLNSNVQDNIAVFFQKEISKAIHMWNFSAVVIDNIPVRIYFYKDFLFVNNYN